jgi:hypothetical protein
MLVSCLPTLALAIAAGPAVTVDPPAIGLVGPRSVQTLLVTGVGPDGRPVDLTRAARYRSASPTVASVTERGLIRAVSDGETEVTVEAGGVSLRVPVKVGGTAQPRAYHFENDIEPLLARFQCNMSGCHGKAEGQAGFKLSVFGFDPDADRVAILTEGRGRRVLPAAPAASLLLRKASGQAAHGGGVRWPAGSDAYETVKEWIAAGAPEGRADAPKVTAVRVEPAERVLGFRGTQQLRVTARWSDGREADVTPHARFQTNNETLAAVDADGLVTAGDAPGGAAVMASYMGQVAVFRALVPRPGPPDLAAKPRTPANFIDPLVDARLAKLNLTPSGPADDAEFLRRVSLDVIGTLPTPGEARAFLADSASDKRARLVESLLTRPEFADYWALKWADLLRVDRQQLGHKRAYAFHRWLREAVASNKPLDALARELVTAEGPLGEAPQAAFYKVATRSTAGASPITPA